MGALSVIDSGSYGDERAFMELCGICWQSYLSFGGGIIGVVGSICFCM